MTRLKLFAFFPGLFLVIAMSFGCSTPMSPTDKVAAGGAGVGTATESSVAALQIEIDVAPNVLNLQNQGQVVTVHTSLLYGDVSASSVTLNGVIIDSWKADNQGQFVAKFLMSAIKGLPLQIGSYNTLRIEGVTAIGTAFWGSQDILVVNNVPRK